ncbi:DNA-methyltransferase [Achromobacter xylosoxidans]|uniref:DNA-methyltransferase n=1 Tax=Alcaligenes xylosoxydans xylosoxydans TaxID=85698 RepID=UPI0023EA6056|nr:DNA methyltransferase [Achromobacter xylosoxidans]
MTVQLHLGDCLVVMRSLPPASVDSIVTDPPYHLTTDKKGGCGQASVNLDSPYGRARIGTGFMGMKWDGGDIAFRPEVWREALRVLKPGGHLLAFGGTRTYHRMVVAIEDAGFDIRDQIGWLYGSGFPKSRNIAQHDLDGEDAERWAGWGTALKPAWEPICVARKPLAGTVAVNVVAHGTGALNIDACRVEVHDADYARNCSGDRGHAGTRSAGREGATNLHASGGSAASGRWPANVIHDGSPEVLAAFPQAGGAQAPVRGTEASAKTANTFSEFCGRTPSDRRDGGGSAARFFYCAKATRADRNEGCETLESKPLNWSSGTQNPGSFQSEGTDKTSQNHHPTVKPTELMAYLCRLVTPPGGVVLDPFMGSGSTGKACMREGFRFIGIDMKPEYVEIAKARIQYVSGKTEPVDRPGASVRVEVSARGQKGAAGPVQVECGRQLQFGMENF